MNKSESIKIGNMGFNKQHLEEEKDIMIVERQLMNMKFIETDKDKIKRLTLEVEYLKDELKKYLI